MWKRSGPVQDNQPYVSLRGAPPPSFQRDRFQSDGADPLPRSIHHADRHTFDDGLRVHPVQGRAGLGRDQAAGSREHSVD